MSTHRIPITDPPFTIDSEPDSDGDYAVHFPNGTWWGYVGPNNMHGIPVPTPPIEPGTKVRTFGGRMGVVLAVDGKWAWVRLDVGGPLSYRISGLTVVEA